MADTEPEVVSAFWKGIDVFRPIALGYAAYSLADRPTDLVRPALGWAVLAVLGAILSMLKFFFTVGLVAVVVMLVVTLVAKAGART